MRFDAHKGTPTRVSSKTQSNMKPQALQDAIKAAALQKTKRRERGGWKEPVVHKHKITADEFKKAKTKGPLLASAPTAVAANPAALQQQQQLLHQIQSEKQSWKVERDELLSQMKVLQTSVKTQAEELASFRTELALVGSLQETVKNQNKELQKIRQELVTVKSQKHDDGASYLSPSPRTTSPTPTSRLLVAGSDKMRRNTKSPSTPQKAKAPSSDLKVKKSPTSAMYMESPVKQSPVRSKSRSKSRGKSRQVPVSIKPHSAETLAKAQRKDKALKEYLKSQTGLPYAHKTLMIQDAVEGDETHHLVLFEERMYIPAKLREQTMAHYVKTRPYDSVTALQQHCIWPDHVEEMKDFRKQRK